MQRQLRERRGEVEAFGIAIKNMEMEAEARQFELEQAVTTLQARLIEEQDQHDNSRGEHAQGVEAMAEQHRNSIALALETTEVHARAAVHHESALAQHKDDSATQLDMVVAQLGALHREESAANERRAADEVERLSGRLQATSADLARCEAALEQLSARHAEGARIEEKTSTEVSDQVGNIVRTKQLEAAALMQEVEATVFDAVDELSAARDAALDERMRLLSNACGVSLATLEASIIGRSNGLAMHLYAARAETRRAREAAFDEGVQLTGVLAAMHDRFRANVGERIDAIVANSALATTGGMAPQHSVGISQTRPAASVEPDDARVAELAAALIEAAGAE